jgi:hypothetical protein
MFNVRFVSIEVPDAYFNVLSVTVFVSIGFSFLGMLFFFLNFVS